MHLTRAFQFYKHRIKIPGQLYQGKNKLVPRISIISKKRAVNRLLVEQNNLDILSKPYLSQQESCGHTKTKVQEQWTKYCESKKQNMLSHKYIQTELDHLNCAKKWE